MNQLTYQEELIERDKRQKEWHSVVGAAVKDVETALLKPQRTCGGNYWHYLK